MNKHYSALLIALCIPLFTMGSPIAFNTNYTGNQTTSSHKNDDTTEVVGHGCLLIELARHIDKPSKLKSISQQPNSENIRSRCSLIRKTQPDNNHQ